MSSQPTVHEPSFPTQAELRALVAEVDRNPLSRQLFFDAIRFRAVVDLDGVVVALNDYARQQRGADVALILDRPMWQDPLFAHDPLWEGRLRSRFAEALAEPTGSIEYEDRVDIEGEAPLLVRVRVATIANDAGLPIGFLVDSSDVGREHRSRALVREQQRLLHVVFERAFQLIAILDAEGTIIDVNDAVGRIGLHRDAVIGRTMMSVAAIEDPGRANEWQERVNAMQTAIEPRRYFDVRDAGPDGGRIATDVSMTPVRNEDGTLDLILLVFRDQTERFAAEERLRESEERFRVLAETLPQMVWSIDADGTIDYLSPSWREFTGHTPEQLLEGMGRDLVHPDDLGVVLQPMPERDVDDRRAFRMRDRHGNYRWMESHARGVLGEDGRVRRWYGATLDVTERHESEETFRSQSHRIDVAAELAGLGSFEWERATQTLNTDDRFNRILGFAPASGDRTAAFRAFLDRVHPDDRERIQRGIAASMEPGGRSFQEDYRIRVEGPDGPEERWIACVARVDFDDDGTPTRMFGAIQDVTAERREDEARVRIQKVEAIGTLVGAIAHDFNNVIGAILTYARVAEAEMAAGEPPTESVAEIARGARRAADILGRLMAFGREETPRHIRFDAAEIVEEAAALLRPTLLHSTELVLDLPAEPPVLDGDPTQIHQVLVNLVTNAGQVLAGRDDGRILVRATTVDLADGDAASAALRPGRYVRIDVHDNGPGFAAGVAHRLFDPFFTTKSVGQGTGLGLAAVQSIVRAHRGSVTASEPSDGGALFTVLLPQQLDPATPTAPNVPELPSVTKAPAAAPPPLAAAPTPPAADVAAPVRRRDGRVHALFVDDEPALVRLAGRAMPYRDIDVSGYVDAAHALAVFSATPDEFDVLVTDLSMPNMTGFELIDAIRALRPEFPVVLTSGYLGSADERAAHERAIDAILPKPCSIDALAAAVGRVTGRTSPPGA